MGALLPPGLVEERRRVCGDLTRLPQLRAEDADEVLKNWDAIKAADPSARTLGPAEWGWTNYFWSALDWSAVWLIATGPGANRSRPR